jgi:hypothetical protein
MCSYHDVHEMNAYRADYVCPHDSVWEKRCILMKFGVDIIPLEATLKSHFLISYNQ